MRDSEERESSSTFSGFIEEQLALETILTNRRGSQVFLRVKCFMPVALGFSNLVLRNHEKGELWEAVKGKIPLLLRGLLFELEIENGIF